MSVTITKEKLAPIVIFCYNRPDHLGSLIASLKKNKEAQESILYIFSDGAKSTIDNNAVSAVRTMIAQVHGFAEKTVILREKNMGLAQNIISGVTTVMHKHDAAIVLEDDQLVSSDFLNYMNRALCFYRDEKQIFSISGYSHPITFPTNYDNDVYCSLRCNSWGWASWRDRWEQADWLVKDFDLFKQDFAKQELFDRGGSDMSDMLFRQMCGTINSWAIRWNYSHFKHAGYSIVPKVSRVINRGCDGSGTHIGKTSRYGTQLHDGLTEAQFYNNPGIHEEILAEIRGFFNKSMRRKIVRLWRKICAKRTKTDYS